MRGKLLEDYKKSTLKKIDEMDLADKEKEHFKSLIKSVDCEYFADVYLFARAISTTRSFEKLKGDKE
jgi:hypothetical protein